MIMNNINFFQIIKVSAIPAESGFKEVHRLRQAQPDSPIEFNFFNSAKIKIYFMRP